MFKQSVAHTHIIRVKTQTHNVAHVFIIIEFSLSIEVLIYASG